MGALFWFVVKIVLIITAMVQIGQHDYGEALVVVISLWFICSLDKPRPPRPRYG